MKALQKPTKICKICFKKLEIADFYQVINGDSCICNLCLDKLKPKFVKFEIEAIDGLAIYEYDDNIKAILYQLKGCYDIELAPVFLNRMKRELHLMYKGYTMVPAPSYYKDDDKREFRHVEEIFKCINLPIEYAVEKISPFKQAEHKRKERGNISHHLRLVKPNVITGKKILIVDDVSTTGSTLKTLVRLVKSAKPKQIKILVMSKRVIK